MNAALDATAVKLEAIGFLFNEIGQREYEPLEAIDVAINDLQEDIADALERFRKAVGPAVGQLERVAAVMEDDVDEIRQRILPREVDDDAKTALDNAGLCRYSAMTAVAKMDGAVGVT